MAKQPTWDDTEEIKEEVPKFEDTMEVDEPSQLEAAARGVGQGLTFGFLDELISTLGTKGASPSQIVAEPKKAIETEKQMMKDYESNLKEQRAIDKELKEAYPATSLTSEIAGGILPALLTGGGTAAGNIAAATTKGGLKQAMKQGAKLGAGYGALSGAGTSEADNLGDLATDIAKGGAIGAGSGAVLPVALKGLSESAKVVGKGVKGTAKLVPGSEHIATGYKYGRQGKTLTEDVVNDEMRTISRRILANIDKLKNKSSLKEAQKELDKLGIKVNTKEAIQETIDDLKNINANDMLGVQNKDLLGKLRTLAGESLQDEKLTEQATKAAIKKTQTAKTMGEEFLDSDTAPLQDIISKVDPSGRPVVQTIDKNLGRVTTLVGNIENRVHKNLSNMTVSEVEALRKQLNVVTNMAKTQGTSSDPVIQRAMQLASKLKVLTDDAVEKSGNSDLINRRDTFSNLFSAEELLGISKPFSARKDINKELTEIALANRLGFKKGFKGVEEENLAKKLLGKNIINPEDSTQLDLLKKVNQLMNREDYDQVSRSGIYRQLVANLPNAAGRAVNKVASPVRDTTQRLTRLPAERVESIANTLSSSSNAGIQSFGNRLTEAMVQEGAAKNQAIWALSQNPAFRRLIENHTTQSDEELSQLLEPIQELNMDEIEPIEQPVEREVSSEGTLSDKLGARESSNNYQAKNRLGYLGKYQFGGMALQDLGYKNAEGEWTGKDGINSEEDFLNNPDVQEAAFEKWVPIVKKYNTSKGLDKYIGQDFNGIKITEDGLFAAAHLVGSKSVQKMLESGEVPEDANGVKATEYLEMFANNEAPVETEEVLEGQMSVDPELQQSIENDIDRVNTQQGSGQDIPMSQLDNLMGKINQLNISEEQINELENDAVNMYSFADGQALKEKIRKLQGLS